MSMLFKCTVLVAVLLQAASHNSARNCNDRDVSHEDQEQLEKICASSGLKVALAEILNNHCLLKCVSDNGEALELNINEGKSCHSEGRAKCQSGQCLVTANARRYKRDEQYLRPEQPEAYGKNKRGEEYGRLFDKYIVTIKIVKGKVPNSDTFPGADELDALAVVRVSNSNGVYSENQAIGQQRNVLDNMRCWNESEQLTTLPLPDTAMLRFEVWDVDWPKKKCMLGYAKLSVEQAKAKSGSYVKLPLMTKEHCGDTDDGYIQVIFEVRKSESF